MVKKYLSLVKFSHTLFALPFALVGFTYALVSTHISFSWSIFLFILLDMVFARNAAMAFNRWADANIDKENPRTAIREIPAGKISKNNALIFVVLNSIAFFITTYFINPLCFLLAPLVLFIILGYSYTKRFTPLCHLILGIGLAIAPTGAYLAVSPQFNIIIALLSIAVFAWVSGFDIIYAMQDVDFDSKHNLYSIPSSIGKKNSLLVSSGLHILTASVLVIIGLKGGFHYLYWLGVFVFSILLIIQHSLVKANDLSRVNLAFFTTNGIASVVFATLFILDLVLFF